MKKITQCINCQSKDFSLVQVVHDPLKTFSVYRCNTCSLLFQNPMPTDEYLQSFYENIYNKQCNLPSTESAFEEYSPTQEKRRIDEIEQFVKKGKILDVGASTGFFLMELKKRKHWQGIGVEYSKTAVKEAKHTHGMSLIHGDISHRKIPNNYFNVVTMHSVLEHIPQQMQTLQLVNKKLKKGGVFVFNVPNVDSFEYKIYQLLHKPFSGFIFEHLYYYTPRAIQSMLEKNGFKIIFMTSFHHSRLSLPPRRPLIGWLTFLPKLLLEYTKFGGSLKKGNILYIYAKKTN